MGLHGLRASGNGVTWTDVGSVHLSGLPTGAQVGMFVAAPTQNSLGLLELGSA